MRTRIIAVIDPASPRLKHWMRLLGTDRIEIESAEAHQALADDGNQGPFYRMKVGSLTPDQFHRVALDIAMRFDRDLDEVMTEIAGEHGMPIEARDVTISVVPVLTSEDYS